MDADLLELEFISLIDKISNLSKDEKFKFILKDSVSGGVTYLEELPFFLEYKG